MRTKKDRVFWALGILVLVALVSCDIGNWDITHGAPSRRNFDAWEDIDFLTGEILSGPRAGQFVAGRDVVVDVHGIERAVGRGAYPLIFGTSSHARGSAILGSGQRSMRFQNAQFQGQAGNHPAQNPVAPPRPFDAPPDFNHGFHGQELPPNVPPGFIEIAATRSGQGGGKIAGSEDGIAFLFREVPIDRNFFMQADFTVVSYGLVNATAPHIPGSNGQEGFGIMVRDFVPQISEGLPGRPASGGAVPTGTTMELWERNHRWRFESAGHASIPGTGSSAPIYADRSPTGSYFLRGMVHNANLLGAEEIVVAAGDRDVGSSPRNTSFHYFVGSAGFGADSNMMMAGGTKRGMRIKWRAGILPGATEMGHCGNPTESGTQNSGRFRFDYQPRALGDYSRFTEVMPGGHEPVPTMSARPDFPRWGTTVRVTLERTNDGFVYSIRNLDDTFFAFDLDGIGGNDPTGRPLQPDGTFVQPGDVHLPSPKPPVTSEQPGMGVIPWRDILGQVNNRHFYVGLFASRDAVVWVNMDTLVYREAYDRFTTPATPFRPTPFEPTMEVLSPPYYGGVNYLYVRANTAGTLSVIQNGRRIPENLIINEWIVEAQNGIAVPQSLFTVPIWEPDEGENVFHITFHPGNIPRALEERGLAISSHRSISQSFNMVRRTLRGGTDPIYVAPLAARGPVQQTEAPFAWIPARRAGVPEAGVFGSPDGAGTPISPLDLQTAINHVMPGQHIVMLNGLYIMDSVLTIPRFNDGREWLNAPGGASGRKVLRAENVNRVWLDWDKNEELGPEGMGIIGGEAFLLAGSWWHLDGFHIRGAPNRTKGIVVGGHNNLITRLMTYNNGDTGFQISGFSRDPVRFWPSGNVVKWTESFHNFDIAQTNADGFGVKLTVGPGNRFYASIAHHNNDDGWDLFSKRDTGPIGVVVVEYSIAYRQGNMLNDFETSAGHNGFKMGGEGIGIFHLIRESLAFANSNTSDRGWQITSNSNPHQIVRDTTTAHSDGVRAGNIEVRGGGGAGMAAGNTHTSVALLSSRQGGQPAAFASTAAAFAPNAPAGQTQTARPHPGFGDMLFNWENEDTDWRSHMVTRPADFWGPVSGFTDTGTTHSFHANGPSGTGSGRDAGGREIPPMPSCYREWHVFGEHFLPRDEFFAYPLLGNLYRAPEGFGAHGLVRDASNPVDAARISNVRTVIPWAVPERGNGF